MDNIKDDEYYLSRIKDNLLFICNHMEHISFEDYSKDEILQDSMAFRLIQISEDSKRLTDSYKGGRSEIPWNDIVGLRNRIVHDYGNVDLSIVYETLKKDIPDVLELIRK